MSTLFNKCYLLIVSSFSFKIKSYFQTSIWFGLQQISLLVSKFGNENLFEIYEVKIFMFNFLLMNSYLECLMSPKNNFRERICEV